VIRDHSKRSQGVEEPDLPPNLFVVGLLRDLKEGGYSLHAWGRFWRDSWVRSVQMIQEHAELRQSWIGFGLVGATAIITVSLASLRFLPAEEAFWFFLSSLLWWAVLMTDLGLHLGLMVNLETGEMERSLGWPNRLTELRGFSAVWVAWGAHWASAGSYIPLLTVFAAAGASDLLDGWLARRRHVSTRWGRLYDPFMDGLFFSVAAVALAKINVLPDWLAALVVFRYAFPIVGAIVFIFVRRRTPRVKHTTWGRLSSAAIGLMVILAAATNVFQVPVPFLVPAIYAVVCISMLGALITILMKGVEQI
jgi:cardiolipin synthase